MVLAEHQFRPHRNVGNWIDAVILEQRANPRFVPETELVNSASLSLVVGIDSVAGTISFTMYILETRSAVRAEAEALFADGIPSDEGPRGMDVTNRMVMVTLRMRPILEALKRSVATSLNLRACRTEAGEAVLIAFSVPHFLPECSSDLKHFDIDRCLVG